MESCKRIFNKSEDKKNGTTFLKCKSTFRGLFLSLTKNSLKIVSSSSKKSDINNDIKICVVGVR